MRYIIRQLLFIAALLLCAGHLFSQDNYAENIKKEVSSSDKMLITYDIKADNGSKYYNVIILITHEGQKVQANSAYGDYGGKISPGTEKAIVWYYKNDFEGDITKVEVDVFAYKENEPQAEFLLGTKSNNGYAPCEVTFINKSTFANDYKWDFGDQTSGIKNHSFEKDPKHVFEKGGLYKITLIATNTELEMDSPFYFTLRVLEHPPVIAEFDYEIINAEPPFEVEFQDNSTNADVFSWDFGDPSSGNRKNASTSRSPKHKFKISGVYQVSLTVSNTISGLTNTLTKEITFTEPEPPVANFVSSLTSEIAPAIAIFKNTSENAEAFKWNFGDPGSGSKNESNEKDPTHTYNIPGKYEVMLTARNISGKTISVTRSIEILEPPKPPEASFTIQNNNAIAPSTIIFSNTSVHADKFSWDFGDPTSGAGNQSNKQDPTHTYSKAGRYEVKLESTSSSLEQSASYSDFVILVEPVLPPEAGFTFDEGEFVAPVSIQFNNTSANADRFHWSFGDAESGNSNESTEANPSHLFSKGGRYRVSLTSTNSESGETSINAQTISIAEPAKPPVAAFTVNTGAGIAPASVRFENLSENADSYSWDFGDPGSGNNNTSDLENPNHTYETPGSYKVVLTSRSSKSEDISTYSETVIVAEPAIVPIADFKFEPEEAEAPVSVVFTNMSNKADSYSWNFGDPSSGERNTSEQISPQHLFEKEGNFQITLIATNSSSGETNKVTKRISIAKPIPPPVADFTFTMDGNMAPIEVSFTNNSNNGDLFAWDFGDPESGNNESSEANPKHLFSNPGSYEVKLKVTASKTGKSDVVSKTIGIVSEYKTFVNVSGGDTDNEISRSIVQESSDEFLVLISSDNGSSKFIRINKDGETIKEKDFDLQLFDVAYGPDEKNFVVAGHEEDSLLTIQSLSADLDIEEPVRLEGVSKLDRSFSTPKISTAANGEVGIAGNIIKSGMPADFWFQKIDTDGEPVPVKGMTFKFIGIKHENSMIPSHDGGFAITGFWQEDESKPKRLMFASVNQEGKGYLKAITAVTNFIGCDIVESHTGGYGILAAQGNPLDESKFNIVFMIVGLDGGPISFSGPVHGDLFLNDIEKFPPCLTATDGGYVIASHKHNGTDYDIMISWIDITGEMIMKQETISREGDQFVTDILQLEDGSYIITGAEKIGASYDAMIIRTDPFGRINPDK